MTRAARLPDASEPDRTGLILLRPGRPPLTEAELEDRVRLQEPMGPWGGPDLRPLITTLEAERIIERWQRGER